MARLDSATGQGWAPLRPLAAQVDANDPAHFTVGYKTGRWEGVIDGSLRDDDLVAARANMSWVMPSGARGKGAGARPIIADAIHEAWRHRIGRFADGAGGDDVRVGPGGDGRGV